MNKLRWCNRGLLYLPFAFTLVTSEQQFYAELKKLKVPRHKWPRFIANEHSDATVHSFAETKEHDAFKIVCVDIKRSKNGVEIAGLIVHEAVHIWQDFAGNIGETYPSAEFEAYAIQAISQELMQCYVESL